MDRGYVRGPGPSRGWQIVISCLLWAGQLVVLAVCLVIMLAGLESNGMWYTAVLEKTRFDVWLLGSAVALLTVITGLGSFYGLYQVTRRGLGAVLAQAVLTVAVIVVVIGFHSAVPVPPGTHSGQMFTGY